MPDLSVLDVCVRTDSGNHARYASEPSFLTLPPLCPSRGSSAVTRTRSIIDELSRDPLFVIWIMAARLSPRVRNMNLHHVTPAVADQSRREGGDRVVRIREAI